MENQFPPGLCPEFDASQSSFPVAQVQGRHRLSDGCDWTEYSSSTAVVTAVQGEFDQLLRSDNTLAKISDALARRGCKAVVIGGWLRDQLLERSTTGRIESRDIDLVVQCTDERDLSFSLPAANKKTVFGGLTFASPSLGVDLWSLDDTYLFKRFGLASTFSNVLAVTDFNINAILFHPRQFWQQPRLVDGGCFDAIDRCEIDFHFEWLPIPVTQVARLVHFASKTGFSFAEQVKQFIRQVCADQSAREEVIKNLDEHCPDEFRAGAKAVLQSVLIATRTRYFSNCLGVFEGGGVRAAAFAGAYSAASEAGIAFTRISGTSGGSIAAAFLATGAHPDRVKEELFSVDLSQLAHRLDKRKFLGRRWRVVKRVLRLVTWSRLRVLLTLDLFGGQYTSSDLEKWIDGALHRLLSSRGLHVGSRAVTFADLTIPLYVIASDLAQNRAHIWNRDSSPTTSVAYAVRCSCSIPLFFQPVRGEGDSIYADGGMLSNTPAFVFREEQGNDASKYAPRILAFRLTQTNREETDILGSFDTLLRAVANTVIDGATHLQRGLQAGVYTIDIDTGSIGSTDFEKVNKREKLRLYTSGRSAVQAFVLDERNRLSALNLPNAYVGRDQKMLLFVQTLRDCNSEVIFVDSSSDWLYVIFPAFLAAAKRGVRIAYVTLSSGVDNHEAYRRRLLEGIGARVFAVQELPFRGFVADAGSTVALAAVTESRNAAETFDHESTKTYSAPADETVILKLYAEIAPFIKQSQWTCKLDSIQYRLCAEGKLFGRLRGVPQYSKARFAVREVVLDEDLLALQSHIKEFKYLQIDWLVQDFTTHNIDLFLPQEVALAGGSSTIITPPVVEDCGRSKVMIEGHTRAFHCLRSGKRSFLAIVVSDVDVALPTKTQRFLDLAVASRTLNFRTQFGDADRKLWREIEPHVHLTTD